jgi:hypothetical protein
MIGLFTCCKKMDVNLQMLYICQKLIVYTLTIYIINVECANIITNHHV